MPPKNVNPPPEYPRPPAPPRPPERVGGKPAEAEIEALLAGHTVDAATLGRHLDLSTRRVFQLAQDGVLPRADRGEYPLIAGMEAYIRFLQAKLSGSGDASDLSSQRAKLAAAQREHTELRNKQLRGELVPSGAAVRALQALAGAMKSRLSNMPAVIRQRFPDAPAGLASSLEDLIEDALRQVATSGLPAEYRAAIPGNGGDSPPATQDDPIRVG